MPLIALIDDRQTNRNIFSHLAATFVEKYEIVTFADASAALEAFAERVPDLVVSDYNMPGLNGAEFTRAFRQLPKCADVPVIVITVHGDRARKLLALEAGATDFLSSPVDPVEFVTRGRNLLKLRLSQLQLEKRTQRLLGSLASTKASKLFAERDSGGRLMQVIDSLPMLISAVDRNGVILFSNALSKTFKPISPPPKWKSPREQISSQPQALPFEAAYLDQFGRERLFLMHESPLRGSDAQITGTLTMGFDVTTPAVPRPQTTASESLPHVDKAGLLRQMHVFMRRGRRPDQEFALLLVRVNGLAEVNRLLGHTRDDHFFQVLMERLGVVLRESDVLAVIDADMIAILQNQINNLQDPLLLAKRVQGVVRDAGALVDDQAGTAAAIGVALFPLHATAPTTLFEAALTALQQAQSDLSIGFADPQPQSEVA